MRKVPNHKMECKTFGDLLGRTMVRIEGAIMESDKIIFTMENGDKYMLCHHQNCCENVAVEDVIGDVRDLIGSPILMAEEVSHVNENPVGVNIPRSQDSFTWTFYKFATARGYVTIRWYGESNGYYSESVDFERLT